MVLPSQFFGVSNLVYQAYTETESELESGPSYPTAPFVFSYYFPILFQQHSLAMSVQLDKATLASSQTLEM
jgi:hypothetical protein